MEDHRSTVLNRNLGLTLLNHMSNQDICNAAIAACTKWQSNWTSVYRCSQKCKMHVYGYHIVVLLRSCLTMIVMNVFMFPGTPQLSSEDSCTVTVRVQRNKNCPAFQGMPYTKTIQQTQAVDSEILQIQATDSDPRVSACGLILMCQHVFNIRDLCTIYVGWPKRNDFVDCSHDLRNQICLYMLVIAEL